jgi:ankyrin repeat protein
MESVPRESSPQSSLLKSGAVIPASVLSEVLMFLTIVWSQTGNLQNECMPLHLACKAGDLDMISLLLASGANIESENEVSVSVYM